MYNMENSAQDNKKSGAVFDLELEMTNPNKAQEMKMAVQEKVQQLQNSLREGSDKEQFEKQQTLLAGYLALQKVLGRINRKMM